MTAVYAKLLDSTLRAEFDAYQQRVNIRGERIAVLPADVPDDAVLLKERIARAKQTLPNGYCGLPLQLECPHPNACLSCDAFLTDVSFRPVLEQQLERTRELIGRATEAGHERVIEINSRDETSLVAILDALDAIERRPHRSRLRSARPRRRHRRRGGRMNAQPIQLADYAARRTSAKRRAAGRGDPPPRSSAAVRSPSPPSPARPASTAPGFTPRPTSHTRSPNSASRPARR